MILSKTSTPGYLVSEGELPNLPYSIEDYPGVIELLQENSLTTYTLLSFNTGRDKGVWFCFSCGTSHNEHTGELDGWDVDEGDVMCPANHCASPISMKWLAPSHSHPTFDVVSQSFRDNDGKRVGDNSSHHCPKCYGHTKEVSVNDYAEQHQCVEQHCGYKFSVS